eukprot:gene11261-14397_t
MRARLQSTQDSQMTTAARSLANGIALPTYADVEAAAKRIAGVAHRTSALTSRTANERTGANL